MTEQQTAIKHTRKQIMAHISNSLESLSPDQKKKLKEFLEVNVDIKKNKITITLPFSFARYLKDYKI